MNFIIFLFSSSIIIIYLYLRQKLLYWKKRGAPHLPNQLFNEISWLVLTDSRFQCYKNIYDKLAPHKYGGFSSIPPKMMIRDPELLNHILIKESEIFGSREKLFYLEDDPLTHFIFNNEGKEWKEMRTRLTPGFSSAKLKKMFDLLIDCALNMDTLLDQYEDGKIIEMKNVVSRYAMDVIFSSTFGLEAGAIANPNSIYLKMGGIVRGKNGIAKKLKNVSFLIPWRIRHYFGISLYKEDARDFFKQIILDSIKYREKNQIYRDDFLQDFIKLMNSNDETHEYKWTMNKTLAHCILYILAGYSTTASAITFALYELAKNPRIQEKLQNEIDRILGEYNGEMKYENIVEMKYLNRVISESMRKYCIIPAFSRKCTVNTSLPDGFVIEKDTVVFVATSGIHHDPEYYPDPMKFDPERFNEENKMKRHSCTYFPFGIGPRNCIGERYALLMMKAAIITIIKKFSISILPEHDFEFSFLPNKLTTEVSSVQLQLTKRKISESNS